MPAEKCLKRGDFHQEFLARGSSNKKEFFSDNIVTTIFNVLYLIFETVILIIRFWVTAIQEVIAKLTATERDVSSDVVLITGAGHGMGKELSLQYSALGATIVCWDINEKLNQETVKLIKSKGGKAFGYT